MERNEFTFKSLAGSILLAPGLFLLCGHLLFAARYQLLGSLMATPIIEAQRDPVLHQFGQAHPHYDLVEHHQLGQILARATNCGQAETAV